MANFFFSRSSRRRSSMRRRMASSLDIVGQRGWVEAVLERGYGDCARRRENSTLPTDQKTGGRPRSRPAHTRVKVYVHIQTAAQEDTSKQSAQTASAASLTARAVPAPHAAVALPPACACALPPLCTMAAKCAHTLSAKHSGKEARPSLHTLGHHVVAACPTCVAAPRLLSLLRAAAQ